MSMLMDKYHLHWFTDEIEVHTSLALQSYEVLEKLLEDPETRQSRKVWYALFAFLVHVAMVSKLFSPNGTGSLDRGQDLKAHLKIGEDSVLLQRAARNNMEHIDERIDGWARRGESKIIEMVVDDRAGYEHILGKNGAVRRVLILDEMVFVSEDRYGKKLETALCPLREELLGLQDRCLRKLKSESPYTIISPSRP
jgi:hypothetical protein